MSLIGEFVNAIFLETHEIYCCYSFELAWELS